MQSFRLTTIKLVILLVFGAFSLQAQDMLISGIVDGPLSGGTKAVELTVLNDIADLSIYGIGSANNGGGSDGEEFTFPAVSATAGQCIYVAGGGDGNFATFFGFTPDYEDGAANINGDDAVELFQNGGVIDVFGELTYSGDPTWEFTDGWVYRVNGTGPDGSVYNPANWSNTGVDVLDNETSNSTAAFPFPLCTYEDVMSSTPEFNFASPFINVGEADGSVDVNVNLSIAADCSIEVVLLGSSTATEGSDFNVSLSQTLTFTASGTTTQLINIPITDDTDFEGLETIVLGLQNVAGAGGCAIGGTDEVTVNITDNEYNQVSIGSLAADDASGVSLFLGDRVEVTGIVYCTDFRGGSGYEMYIADATGGINIFSFSDVDSYVTTEGDEITVRGEVDQFRGLTEIIPDEIILNSQGNAVIPPVDVATPSEDNESQLIRLLSVSLVDPTQWTTGMGGFGFEVEVTDGTNVSNMLIDSDTELYNLPAPVGSFNISGVCNQRASSTSAPFLDGYRIIPCTSDDFDPANNINDPVLALEVQVFPNPVSGMLNVQTGDLDVQELRLVNVLGQTAKFMSEPTQQFQMNLSDLQSGIYFLELISEKGTVIKEIVVQ